MQVQGRRAHPGQRRDAAAAADRAVRCGATAAADPAGQQATAAVIRLPIG